MVKPLSTAFRAHLSGSHTTLAFCWLLRLRDGRVLGFTTHDQPLVIAGVTYEPDTGAAASAVKANLSGESDDVDLVCLFDSAQVSESDLVSGALDGAEFEYFQVNWQVLPADLETEPFEYLPLTSGRLGQYSANERAFTVEGMSLIDRLAEKQAIVTSPVCRATLGDGKCQVNLVSYTHDFVVVSATNINITVTGLTQGDGYFDNGEIQFLDGDNAPNRFKIATNLGQVIRLFSPIFYPIVAGTAIRCIAGCDKRLVTCRDKFNNVANFRGEPSLPGQDVWASGTPSFEREDGSEDDE